MLYVVQKHVIVKRYLSHTLMRLNAKHIIDNSKYDTAQASSTIDTIVMNSKKLKREVIKELDKNVSSSHKQARQDDSSHDADNGMQQDDICFVNVNTTSITKIPITLTLLKPTIDRVNFYSATPDESFVYDNDCIIKQDGLQKFLEFYQKTWLSLAPRIPSIAYHLHRVLHQQIDIVVIEPNRVFAGMAQIMLPNATVASLSLADFNSAILLPIPPNKSASVSSGAIQENLDNISISPAGSHIYGVDITLKTRLSFPLP